MTLKDKVAVVTGASSGIGRAVAIRFAAEGARVVAADRQAEPREGGDSTEQVIARDGGSVVFHLGDITDADRREALFDLTASLGGVDVLVNSAGILRRGSFLQFSEQDFDDLMDVNVRASFFVAQAAAAQMVEHGRGGSIVNLSSLAGLKGSAGLTGYCTSKGAVRLLTYAMADELGVHGIRVNALHPGLIDTALNRIDVPILDTARGDDVIAAIPLRQAGAPEDVAEAAVHLASDASKYMTGSSLMVDGGMFRS